MSYLWPVVCPAKQLLEILLELHQAGIVHRGGSTPSAFSCQYIPKWIFPRFE